MTDPDLPVEHYLGRHARYDCQMCGISGNENGEYQVTFFPSRDAFLLCEPHAADALKFSNVAFRKIHG